MSVICTDCTAPLTTSEAFWTYRDGYGPGSSAPLREKCGPVCRECLRDRQKEKRREEKAA